MYALYRAVPYELKDELGMRREPCPTFPTDLNTLQRDARRPTNVLGDPVASPALHRTIMTNTLPLSVCPRLIAYMHYVTITNDMAHATLKRYS